MKLQISLLIGPRKLAALHIEDLMQNPELRLRHLHIDKPADAHTKTCISTPDTNIRDSPTVLDSSCARSDTCDS